jgi:endonuclease-3
MADSSERRVEEYVNTVIKRLRSRYGSSLRTSLRHSNPWELLVATILSAQSPDTQVNRITPRLFGRYRSVGDFAAIRPQLLYPYLKSLGLYKSKAKYIVNSARIIQKNFNGRVPHSMNELTSLPGVGRKTANVVISGAFGRNEGIAIDTHCIMTANRLGLVRTRDAAKIERRLMRIVPVREWGDVSLLLISLGRDVCTAKVKYCYKCVLNDICPSSNVRRKRGRS